MKYKDIAASCIVMIITYFIVVASIDKKEKDYQSAYEKGYEASQTEMFVNTDLLTDAPIVDALEIILHTTEILLPGQDRRKIAALNEAIRIIEEGGG